MTSGTPTIPGTLGLAGGRGHCWASAVALYICEIVKCFHIYGRVCQYDETDSSALAKQ